MKYIAKYTHIYYARSSDKCDESYSLRVTVNKGDIFYLADSENDLKVINNANIMLCMHSKEFYERFKEVPDE